MEKSSETPLHPEGSPLLSLAFAQQSTFQYNRDLEIKHTIPIVIASF